MSVFAGANPEGTAGGEGWVGGVRSAEGDEAQTPKESREWEMRISFSVLIRLGRLFLTGEGEFPIVGNCGIEGEISLSLTVDQIILPTSDSKLIFTDINLFSNFMSVAATNR